MVIKVSVEFGYSHWLWTPSQTNFKKLQKMFTSRVNTIGYVPNPQWVDPEGEWAEIYLHFPEEGDCKMDYHPSCECIHCEGEWKFAGGGKALLPNNDIRCHIHEPDDSFLERDTKLMGE